MWICMRKRLRNFLQIFSDFLIFVPHFGLENTSQNHLKIDSGSLWRRFGIDLVLQGPIWVDWDWLGLDFSSIWARFWLYFWMGQAWFLRTIALWTKCINCCTQPQIFAFTWNLSNCHLVRRVAHRASAASCKDAWRAGSDIKGIQKKPCTSILQ